MPKYIEECRQIEEHTEQRAGNHRNFVYIPVELLESKRSLERSQYIRVYLEFLQNCAVLYSTMKDFGHYSSEEQIAVDLYETMIIDGGILHCFKEKDHDIVKLYMKHAQLC